MNPKIICPKETYYETTAATIIKHLEERQMEGYYCKTAKEAVTLAASFLPQSATVSFGGSMTLEETGMLSFLREKEDLTLLDRSTAKSQEEVQEIYAKAFTADAYFMSTNAITTDGRLVNIDGTGNRVAALIWGPKQVILLAGMNKVCPTLEDAYRRVKNIASPPNCIRLNRKTPCAATGVCGDCLSPDCICSQTVITRRSGIPGRIKVILIGENYGY